MAKKRYLCKNPRCSLGDVHNPGRFTGGMSKDGAVLLTGDPEAKHGQGVCPNCGEEGVEE